MRRVLEFGRPAPVGATLSPTTPSSRFADSLIRSLPLRGSDKFKLRPDHGRIANHVRDAGENASYSKSQRDTGPGRYTKVTMPTESPTSMLAPWQRARRECSTGFRP